MASVNGAQAARLLHSAYLLFIDQAEGVICENLQGTVSEELKAKISAIFDDWCEGLMKVVLNIRPESDIKVEWNKHDENDNLRIALNARSLIFAT